MAPGRVAGGGAGRAGGAGHDAAVLRAGQGWAREGRDLPPLPGRAEAAGGQRAVEGGPAAGAGGGDHGPRDAALHKARVHHAGAGRGGAAAQGAGRRRPRGPAHHRAVLAHQAEPRRQRRRLRPALSNKLCCSKRTITIPKHQIHQSLCPNCSLQVRFSRSRSSLLTGKSSSIR